MIGANLIRNLNIKYIQYFRSEILWWGRTLRTVEHWEFGLSCETIANQEVTLLKMEAQHTAMKWVKHKLRWKSAMEVHHKIGLMIDSCVCSCSRDFFLTYEAMFVCDKVTFVGVRFQVWEILKTLVFSERRLLVWGIPLNTTHGKNKTVNTFSHVWGLSHFKNWFTS